MMASIRAVVNKRARERDRKSGRGSEREGAAWREAQRAQAQRWDLEAKLSMRQRAQAQRCLRIFSQGTNARCSLNGIVSVSRTR